MRVLVEEQRTLRKSDPFRAALSATRVWAGRSPGEAPGVDGAICFTGAAETGTFVEVALDGNGPFDFYGHVSVPEGALVG